MNEELARSDLIKLYKEVDRLRNTVEQLVETVGQCMADMDDQAAAAVGDQVRRITAGEVADNALDVQAIVDERVNKALMDRFGVEDINE